MHKTCYKKTPLTGIKHAIFKLQDRKDKYMEASISLLLDF